MSQKFENIIEVLQNKQYNRRVNYKGGRKLTVKMPKMYERIDRRSIEIKLNNDMTK